MRVQRIFPLVWGLAMVVALVAAGPVRAEETPPPAQGQDSRLNFIPIPVLFYTPETHLGFGAAGLLIRSGDNRQRPSTYSGTVIFTTKSQFLGALGAELYFGRDQLTVGGSYSEFPSTFYGIGNDSPESAEEDYTPREVSAAVLALKDLGRGFKLGGQVQARHVDLVEIEDEGLLAAPDFPGAAGGWLAGFGVTGSFDTRDNLFGPRRGFFLQAGASRFEGAVGSDYEFDRLNVDLRGYLPVRSRDAVAIRVLYTGTTDSPPFYALPGLGGDSLLRGHFEGRFRDRHLGAAQAEYRLRLSQRWVVAVFLAAGQVAGSLEDAGWDAFRGVGGAGVRFVLGGDEEEEIRLRADWGVGEDASGFYISLGEAF